MGAVRLLLLCGRRGNTRLQRLTIKVPQLHAAVRAARGESHSVAPHIDGEYSIAMSLHDRGRWRVFLPTSQNGALFSPRGQQRPPRNRARECAKVERNHLPKLRTVARAGMDGSRVHAPPRRVLATLCAHAHGGSPALGWFPSYLQLRGGRARSARARPKCNSKTVQQDLRPHTPAALRDGLMMRKQQGQCG